MEFTVSNGLSMFLRNIAGNDAAPDMFQHEME